MQFPHGFGDVAFDCICRYMQVFCDLLIRPASGGEHRHGKLGGGQIVGDIVPGDRIMHSTPPEEKR